MGNLRFNFFFQKSFQDELKLKNINLDIGFVKNVSKFNSVEFYDFLRKFNSLTFDQIIFQFKKLISKMYLYLIKTKNLVFEPLWDFFYYPYKLNQNYFISLDKIYSKKTNKNYFNLDFENIIKKK